MKILIKKLIVFTIVIMLSQQALGQEKIEKPNFEIMDAIAEAKSELKGTDIGTKLDLWHSLLKANNIKLKMLFDEEGFVTMLKMISLGNRLIRDNALLKSSDVNNILSFISVAERLGCGAPAGLTEKISNCLYLSVGKNWKDCINLLKAD